MNRARSGFTLVEVLVALVIVAVALAAGMRAAAGVVDGAQRQADVSAAQWCADNQLTALKLSRQLPGLGTADFSCEQLGRTYNGTLRTQPTPNPNFRRVEALVRGEDGHLTVAEADSVDESQIIVFDSHAKDPGLAFGLSRLSKVKSLRDTAIGVFRDVERPSYDRLVREQIASVRESGEGDLESLIRGKDTWTVS